MRHYPSRARHGVLGCDEKEARRVVVIGGGNIGLELARLLEEKHRHVQLKVVEADKERVEQVARALHRSLVIHGDALEQEILTEANVATAETTIAVSNDDKVNILTALLAKQAGAQRTIVLINSSSYGQLLPRLGIDTVVSPRDHCFVHPPARSSRTDLRCAFPIGRGGEIIAEVLETL